MGRVREEKRIKRRSERRKSEKKEEAGARKGRKVVIHCVFPMTCGSGGFKGRLTKAAGAEPAGQMRDEKLHGIVARSTFPSQNVQNTSRSDHFWKLSCRKSVRRCGAKHVSKSKCTKHTNVGPLLEVEMSKKCTPLFPSQNVQNTPCSDHFLTFRGRKSARRCGAKQIRGYALCRRPQGVFPGSVSEGLVDINVFDFQYECKLRKHGLSIP